MVDEGLIDLPVDELSVMHAELAVPADKGRKLEQFCCQFFSAIPGVEVAERNLIDDAQSQEVDIALYNDQHPSGLSRLDEILFVEAKNWSAPVGSAEVAWFDWKIRLSGYKQGFLVAANGITGRSDDRTSAWRIIDQANLEGRKLIVLTPDEMVRCTTSLQFKSLVRHKVLQIAAHKAQIT